MKEQDIRNREIFNQYLALVKKDVERYFGDDSDYVSVKCPACLCDDYTEQMVKNNFTYVACVNCNTLFVNPRPGFDSLINFYAKSDSTSFWIEKFFKPVVEARRRKIFKPRAEYITNMLKNANVNKVGDIGAGFGLFLDELKKVWKDVDLYAIEPSPEQAKICRYNGHSVIRSAFEDVKGYDNYFDLLTSFEVFEHLYSPENFLRHAFSLIKPGGYYYMTTLNGEGFDIRALWDKSKSLNPPLHINFFNPEAMELIFERCGFREVEISTPGKLDWDIVEGMIKNESIDEIDRFWIMLANKGSEESKKALQDWIVKYKFSSHISVIAKK